MVNGVSYDYIYYWFRVIELDMETYFWFNVMELVMYAYLYRLRSNEIELVMNTCL